MNNDNSPTGQQGYGRDPQSDRQTKEPTSQQGGQQSQDQQQARSPNSQNAQPIGGNDSNTGSGTTMSSGSSTGDISSGQASYGNSGETDTMSQSRNRSDEGQQADMGQAGGKGGSGFVGSSANDSGEYLQSSAGDRDFAEQGRGAIEDPSVDAAGADVETERSQGRESDIEGSSL